MSCIIKICLMTVSVPAVAGLGLFGSVELKGNRFKGEGGHLTQPYENATISETQSRGCTAGHFFGSEYVNPADAAANTPPDYRTHNDAELRLFSDGTGLYRPDKSATEKAITPMFCNEHMFYGKLEWEGNSVAFHCSIDSERVLCTFNLPNKYQCPKCNSKMYRFESGDAMRLPSGIGPGKCNCGFFDEPEPDNKYDGNEFLFPNREVDGRPFILPDNMNADGNCGELHTASSSVDHFHMVRSCGSLHWYGMLWWADKGLASQFLCTKLVNSSASAMVCSYNYLEDFYFTTDGITSHPFGRWEQIETGTNIAYSITTGMSWSRADTVTDTDKIGLSTAMKASGKFMGFGTEISVSVSYEHTMAEAVMDSETKTSTETRSTHCDDTSELPPGHTEWGLYQWTLQGSMLTGSMFKSPDPNDWVESQILKSQKAHWKCMPNDMEPKCPQDCCKTNDKWCQVCKPGCFTSP